MPLGTGSGPTEVQEPDGPTQGYIHWSSYLYEDKSKSPDQVYGFRTGWDAFVCPALDDGGLPPTNPHPNMIVGGQQRDPRSGSADRVHQGDPMPTTTRAAVVWGHHEDWKVEQSP